MSELSRLAQADAHLRQAYGTPDVPSADNGWQLFLRVLLWGPAAELSKPAAADALKSSLLASPVETSAASTGLLVEHLAAIPRGPQKASLLRTIAGWWLKQFGDDLSPEWKGDPSGYRESLRQIRGLGPATVDELLLFAAGLSVFPLDRGALRVAVRHGWLDLPLEDEEAQNVFVRGLKQANIDARQFSRLLGQVADSHCGREPHCDDCPLQPLLPPNGPLNPDSC